MKTLESILSNLERRLSAEEMRNLKGGSATCSCTYYIDGEAVFSQAVSTNHSDGCGHAQQALSSYYEGVWTEVVCN
ncbi:MAG: TIGR04149 family rSAM-modified RiPP [Bacteroidales bacterium]|nr:TIGR04149 family rSAM-modified RiPP [Bacteroidales bacterium]